VKNLTSNLRNDEARMAAVLDNEFHRGVCADVVAKKDAKRAKIDSFQWVPDYFYVFKYFTYISEYFYVSFYFQTFCTYFLKHVCFW
jgi:hypothetical protein